MSLRCQDAHIQPPRNGYEENFVRRSAARAGSSRHVTGDRSLPFSLAYFRLFAQGGATRRCHQICHIFLVGSKLVCVTQRRLTFDSCRNNKYRPERPVNFVYSLNPGVSPSRGVPVSLPHGGFGAAGFPSREVKAGEVSRSPLKQVPSEFVGVCRACTCSEFPFRKIWSLFLT